MIRFDTYEEDDGLRYAMTAKAYEHVCFTTDYTHFHGKTVSTVSTDLWNLWGYPDGFATLHYVVPYDCTSAFENAIETFSAFLSRSQDKVWQVSKTVLITGHCSHGMTFVSETELETIQTWTERYGCDRDMVVASNVLETSKYMGWSLVYIRFTNPRSATAFKLRWV